MVMFWALCASSRRKVTLLLNRTKQMIAPGMPGRLLTRCSNCPNAFPALTTAQKLASGSGWDFRFWPSILWRLRTHPPEPLNRSAAVTNYEPEPKLTGEITAQLSRSTSIHLCR